ncbi:hypothetical protein SAMN03080618_01043 [Aquamicrobium aerolatum DSM 21857]|uniref:Uncharacterized protein n=1 Tax=Aquamicrobium aerolatum DSM 21857 TaxID=1121003 RepID=A0A1I3JXT4_9HYPH|nr:hypothetical protein SAMN03080618_01043 [Aquamicrobium aerolatum DSM 21857]
MHDDKWKYPTFCMALFLFLAAGVVVTYVLLSCCPLVIKGNSKRNAIPIRCKIRIAEKW